MSRVLCADQIEQQHADDVDAYYDAGRDERDGAHNLFSKSADTREACVEDCGVSALAWVRVVEIGGGSVIDEHEYAHKELFEEAEDSGSLESGNARFTSGMGMTCRIKSAASTQTISTYVHTRLRKF